MTRILTVLFILFPLLILGQNPYHLYINAPNEDLNKKKKLNSFETKQELDAFLNRIQFKHIKKGFILTSVDEITWKNDTAFVDLHIGEKFNDIEITFDQKDEYIIRKTPRINERLMSRFPFDSKMVARMLKDLGEHLNNNGYPFAKVYLTVENLDYENSKAHLNIEKGPYVTIKEIHLKGDPKVRSKYVQNALSIKIGQPYSAQVFRNISSRMEQIQFVKEIRPHELLFTPEGVELFLYLENAPISLINGIVGIQPDPVTEKTTVTGDVRLKLQNVLKRGEMLDLNWKSLQPATQELKVHVNYPFLFNTPFGIDAKFNLYKQDSTYLTISFHAGVQYFFSGGSYIKAFYQSDNSNLLSGAGSNIAGNLSSTTNNSYGLNFFWNKVDYLPNPSKGLTVDMSASAGRRKNRVLDVDTSIVSTVFSGSLDLSYYLPITPRHVVRLSNRTRSYYAPDVFQNELYRFGGLNSQRGFNEETLLATTLTTFGVEYRFLVDRNSHAFAFFDQSFYENNATQYRKDHPFGFGLGYSFGTRIGIFSISYALGKQLDNPIQFKNGKIHFGYIAYF